jgi:hypothetical protein
VGIFSAIEEARAIECECKVDKKTVVQITSGAYDSCSQLNGTRYNVSGLGGPEGVLKDCKAKGGSSSKALS